MSARVPPPSSPSRARPPHVSVPALGQPRSPAAVTSPASLTRGLGRCGLLRSSLLDPASTNSQKNRWVSAPARACPASAASTPLLAALGWQPRAHRASLAAWTVQFERRRRESLRPTRLLNSHSPPRPISPSRPPPSSFPNSYLSLPQFQQVTTGSARVAIMEPQGLSPGPLLQTTQRGGGAAHLEPNLFPRQEWT